MQRPFIVSKPYAFTLLVREILCGKIRVNSIV